MQPATTTSTTSRTIGLVAAAGLGGLFANLVRKALVQAPTMAVGRWDRALAAEHKAALAIFDAILKTDATQTVRRTILLTQLKHAVSKHAFQEENAIYAMMRDVAMTEAADHLNHDHGYVKQYFFDLSEKAKDDPAWLIKVAEFRVLIAQHMREEEEELFPALHAALTDRQNAHLTRVMNREGLKLA